MSAGEKKKILKQTIEKVHLCRDLSRNVRR